MSLAKDVHTLIIEIDRLRHLHEQLQRIPDEVQQIFSSLESIHSRLIQIGGTLATRFVELPAQSYATSFASFRAHLVELELFIDPEQVLRRSGPENGSAQVVWNGPSGQAVVSFCDAFTVQLLPLDQDCDTLFKALHRTSPSITSDSGISSPVPSMVLDHQSISSQYSPLESPANRPGTSPNISSSPHTRITISPRHDASYTPGVSGSAMTPFPSPFLLPSSVKTPPDFLPHLSPPVDSINSSSAPYLPPRISPHPSASHVETAAAIATPVSLLGLMTDSAKSSNLPTYGETLMGHLPTIASTTIIRRPKRQGKTLAERKVQQMLLQQFGKSRTAGNKRKRDDGDASNGSKSVCNAPFPPDGSPRAVPHTPPPSYPPSLPRLGPIHHSFEEHPHWSLDDMHDALPAVSPESSSKGKQPASASHMAALPHHWGSGSSANTSSSSISIRSSIRDGSILSDASHERMFQHGAVKLLYRRGVQLHVEVITHIEVRQQLLPSGNGIIIIARTSTGQEVVDQLWIPTMRTNAAPFLENMEIVAAIRHQQREPEIAHIVHFAPHPAKHPQLAFVDKSDCWDFMHAVVGKVLVASVDVATVKSACTHGHAVEAGCETVQVWEDEAAGRSLRLFRNKNKDSGRPVIDLGVGCLRAPERERRTGKVVFGLRDVRDAEIREMKYLKIAFSNDGARDEFLAEVGFSDFAAGGL